MFCCRCNAKENRTFLEPFVTVGASTKKNNIFHTMTGSTSFKTLIWHGRILKLHSTSQWCGPVTFFQK